MKIKSHLKSNDRPALRVSSDWRSEIVDQEIQRDNTTHVNVWFETVEGEPMACGRVANSAHIFRDDCFSEMFRRLVEFHWKITDIGHIIELHFIEKP